MKTSIPKPRNGQTRKGGVGVNCLDTYGRPLSSEQTMNTVALIRFLVCADFAADLERYRLDTENIQNRHKRS